VAILLGLLARAAEPPDTTFDAANRLFEQGKYLEAVAAFETILRSGRTSGALYYNLGNTYFRLGEVGRAIVAYRLAARIAPRDPDVAANLAFARAAVPGTAPPRQSWLARFTGRLTLDEWTIMTGVSLWLWMGILIWRQRITGVGPAGRRLAIGAAGLTVLLAGLLFAAWVQTDGYRSVAVIVDDAVLRHGPLEESPSLQTLHDGQELRALDEKDGWLLVTGAARGQGWIKRDQVLVVR
jgi:tetratricopeptide (TPR) repeat protein